MSSSSKETVIHDARKFPSKETPSLRDQGGNPIVSQVSAEAAEKVSEDLISEVIKRIKADKFNLDDAELSKGVEALIKDRVLSLVDPHLDRKSIDQATSRNESPPSSQIGRFKCQHCPKIKNSASDLK